MVSSELVLVISTHHAGRQVDFLLGLGALQVSHRQLSAWLGNHMQPVSLCFCQWFSGPLSITMPKRTSNSTQVKS